MERKWCSHSGFAPLRESGTAELPHELHEPEHVVRTGRLRVGVDHLIHERRTLLCCQMPGPPTEPDRTPGRERLTWPEVPRTPHHFAIARDPGARTAPRTRRRTHSTAASP